MVKGVHLASANNSFAPIAKLYPRGNHWAVGHLMGKKSTDDLFGPVESKKINDQSLPSPEEGRRLDGYLQPPQLVGGLMGALAGLERQNEAAPHKEMVLDRKREWEMRERDRSMIEVSAQHKLS
ncbi:hypothetical protein AAFF_G00368400 [Aldrovandia affinis]|uniref:Gastrin-releasing peptide n=1 Tax=Aldrovandia affinis TaxID=143900 RepID=A0AAD7SIZ7_9TELE|nr:hypothetical protein AAFF_G00368400 [Aldrovandia affinis]